MAKDCTESHYLRKGREAAWTGKMPYQALKRTLCTPSTSSYGQVTTVAVCRVSASFLRRHQARAAKALRLLSLSQPPILPQPGFQFARYGPGNEEGHSWRDPTQ